MEDILKSRKVFGPLTMLQVQHTRLSGLVNWLESAVVRADGRSLPRRGVGGGWWVVVHSAARLPMVPLRPSCAAKSSSRSTTSSTRHVCVVCVCACACACGFLI